MGYPTNYPTPVGPVGTWAIQSGHSYCHITGDGCIADDQAGSINNRYGNNEACSFTFTGTAKIVSSGGTRGAHMHTESYFDRITVDGVRHSGTANWQVNVAGSKAFTWYSDYSIQGGGFKLCPRAP